MISKGYLVALKLGLRIARIKGNEILVVISDPYRDNSGASIVAVACKDGLAQICVRSLRVISKG